MKTRLLAVLSICLILLSVAVVVRAADPDPAALLAKADRLFEEKNYKEAEEAYKAVAEFTPRHEKWRHASERIIVCKLRLQLFDEAIQAAEGYIERCKDTPYEARAERLTGNLYMTVPHWGTRAGGKFHRAQHMQGIRLRSFKYDKKRAIAHMERARDLYAKYDSENRSTLVLTAEERASWHNERIECLFDLAGVLSRFGIYENQWYFWYSFWGERDEFIAETAGEEDFDEYYSMWQSERKRPIGLRLDPDGNPIFPSAPDDYGQEISEDQKILYLLKEARDLDNTREAKYIGLSYYRQAMLARTRFGMDRMNSYGGLYHVAGKAPLREELEAINPWELGDDEAIILAGGKIRRATLPDQWNVLKLLRIVTRHYANCGIGDQAQYGVGLYYQSRQQYLTAIDEYETTLEKFPQSDWANNARNHIDRIKAPEARVNNCGVQLLGSPAELQVSHRNVSKVWFVARRIDVEGFMKELRNEPIREAKGLRGLWTLNNWHNYFAYPHSRRDWQHRIAAKYIGDEVARWADKVENDPSHRYSETTLQSALDKPGAYLVYAYVDEPPADHAEKRGMAALEIGNSRAVAVLTDLAFVEKRVEKGNLYFICSARSGAPVPGAKVSVLEVWNTYDSVGRKTVYHKRMHNLTSDEQGMAVLESPRDHGSQLHVLVKAGEDRFVWSGISHTSRYNPSRMREGQMAYCITDRPVYRPDQAVRFKVWLRQMQEGTPQNRAHMNVHLTVYDPRGNEIYSKSQRADEYGGIDGEFKLGSEPPLGVYRIHVSSTRFLGGQNFRVEEYKKPEFEVTVEPGKTHTKLGDKIKATIKATYYFGGPVTDATVNYKVFREEYSHRYYFPGEWDWLYGPGYGWVWYEYPWFSWWGRMRCCWGPPTWWWGYRGNPVRELVTEGDTRIGEDGTVHIEIDTAPALLDHSDRDHRYIVKAEVRDASRRVITGEGAVKATRQAYYAFVQPDGGYYRPGDEMVIRIRCLTPDNQPVQTEGLITISSVVFGGPDNAHIEEKELKRWKLSTDERGLADFRLRHEKSGQLKIKFEAPDEWGGTVEGYNLVWVCGRDFDGRLYRFNNLELITDKRTYRPGDVAHVMINTDHANSYVLFSDKVDSNHLISYRLLHLPNKHTVVDIPITKEHHPNFYIEAATVADARVHQQMSQILVPPEEGIVKVAVSTDKAKYRPGETATVNVVAKTPDGKPAQAQLTLSVFDKSVLYIQPEFTPEIAKFFHGNLRRHYLQMQTNLHDQFSAWGSVVRPFQSLYPLPHAWGGIWGPTVGDWRSFADEELSAMTGTVDSYRFNDRLGGMGGMRGDVLMKESAAIAGAPESAARIRSAEKLDVAADSSSPTSPAFAEAEVRKKFADTALWLTTLTTDADGAAQASFEMPENLTTWKINTWAMTKETRVGQADTSAVTTKNLIVRLQAPRFFMERDEVVLSANVHNYLDEDKTARISLDVPEELLKMIGDTPQTVNVKVGAGGETRVDWRVSVLTEGSAEITVKALTDEESDAMQMTFPVLVHGITKQVATTGSMRPDELNRTITVELDVPEQRRPELTRFEVQFAPSLVGAMMDALPYCIYYPYGCTEQTMSRFVPCVLTLKTIQNMGIDLEDVRSIRGRMEEIRRIEKGENISIYWNSPIFDDAKLNVMIAESRSRITNMQHGDGGWGWWTNDSSSAYLTSYVLWALCTARECDLKIDENMIGRGMNFLRNWEISEMRKKHWTPSAQHAYVAYVLSLRKQRATYDPSEEDERSGDLIERLYAGRDKLGLYGKALLCMAQANLDDTQRARIVLQNIMQYLEENEETQVAWFRTTNRGWWYWWNSDIETNAMILRAIVKLEPRSEVSPRLVKWLLNNRRNGYYWRSTRDTTMCIAAISDFVVASGEGTPDYTLTIDLDNGASTKTVKIDKDSFFTYDNRFVVEGVALSGGKHTLKITKDGPGALYFNTYLRYFSMEEPITAAGHELKVDRTYLKLVRIPYEVEVMGSEGQKLVEKRVRYERVPLKDGDVLKSGDVIQVELRVKSDNNYTYLCFEDMKPAGCEPTEVRSGGKGQEGFYSYMELRDEKVVFFVNSLGQGEHLMRYRLRAEIPGVFHALPTVLYGMYVPELRANSNEQIIRIVD